MTKFRFLDYPEKLHVGTETVYLIKVGMDDGLYTVAERLHVKLYDETEILKEKRELESRNSEKALVQAAQGIKEEKIDPWTGPVKQDYSSQKAIIFTSVQDYQSKTALVEALEKQKLSSGEVVAVAHEFGTASLLTVRNTFKNPIYIGLYTIFVLAACFHAAFRFRWLGSQCCDNARRCRRSG